MSNGKSDAGVVFILLALVVIFIQCGGCGGSDHGRVAEMARESLNRQAEQNAQMARQSQQVAEAAKNLVAADAESRKEFVQLQHELQDERETLNTGRDSLEEDRRDLAVERQRESILGSILTRLGFFAMAVIPFVLSGFLLRSVLWRDNPDDALSEILLTDLASDEPRLLITAEAGKDQRLLPAEPPADGEPMSTDPPSEPDAA